MNEKISEFSNRNFYNNKIKASERNKNWIIEFNKFIKDKNNIISKVLNPNKPVVFVDIDKNNVERQNKDSKSYFNYHEVKFIDRIIHKLTKYGIKDHQIGVITPYKAQVEKIDNKISDKHNIEIDTVDSFQGREKDIIILSLVRSNNKNNIGFLNDLRRLNVSITRAKKKLIVLGNKKTIEGHSVYNELINEYKIN